jgi:hypothetical protein
MNTLSDLWQKVWLTQRPDAVTIIHFGSSVRVQCPIEIKCYIYLFVWRTYFVRVLNAYRRIILKWSEENKFIEQSHSWEVTNPLAAGNVSAFWGSRRFVIMFATACHCRLFWVSGIQSTPIPRCFIVLSLFWKSKIRLMRSPCCLWLCICVSLYPPPPLTFECLNQPLLNFICMSWHLRPSQWRTS